MKRSREVESEDAFEEEVSEEEKKKRMMWQEFCRACEKGNVERVRELCSKGIANFNVRWYNITLHVAAHFGHVDIVKVLIQNGADVNAVGKNKKMALHFAAERGHVDVAKLLLENGADVNAADNGKSTALHSAAKKGHVEVAKVLIQNGADVNALKKDNRTALHYAAMNGHVDIVKVLIENGADVNAVDRNIYPSFIIRVHEITPLHLAAREGHVDVAKVLIQNGANVNAVNSDKGTALHEAAHQGRADVAKVLLQSGVIVDAVDVKNSTALCYAAGMCEFDEDGEIVKRVHTRCILHLLCFGAKIDSMALERDKTEILQPINDRLKSLGAGNGMKTTLMSDEERRFMWNLAFSFTIQHRGAAFKAYYAIRSFITYHGIFMASGYELGEDSIWRKEVEMEEEDFYF